MARYQIRAAEDLTLEDIIEELAGKGWDSIKDSLDFSHIHAPLKNYRRFQNALYSAILPSVRSYRLCGNYPVCNEPVTGKTKTSDEIYHLFLHDGEDLNSFARGLCVQAAESLEHALKPERRMQVLQQLHEVFEEVLSDYVCAHPVCGKAPVCGISELAPIQPWFRVVKTTASIRL